MKELIVDFSKQVPPPFPVTIRRIDVEVVKESWYLGVHIDRKIGLVQEH